MQPKAVTNGNKCCEVMTCSYNLHCILSGSIDEVVTAILCLCLCESILSLLMAYVVAFSVQWPPVASWPSQLGLKWPFMCSMQPVTASVQSIQINVSMAWQSHPTVRRLYCDEHLAVLCSGIVVMTSYSAVGGQPVTCMLICVLTHCCGVRYILKYCVWP
jgi:hypothetical protein